ncbi:hypothetical protein B0T24DRAFT_643613 [Lasiosphaeria ovina]|uniref:Uncharacterized protein n=1 Tax=Lasiosphaeria ovina TaxID=92902 RepID=A0AAE0JS64_9PEZI|nr:hypothetical protein B0T24DRAFT_643613 [Lasiosphaeria ovina]
MVAVAWLLWYGLGKVVEGKGKRASYRRLGNLVGVDVETRNQSLYACGSFDLPPAALRPCGGGAGPVLQDSPYGLPSSSPASDAGGP